MSDTKEPFKKYWAYQDYPCELIETGICEITGLKQVKNKYPIEVSEVLHTYLFDTQDEAFDYANDCGAFEMCHGKEDWCELYDRVLFEVCESELEDYTPFVIHKKSGKE